MREPRWRAPSSDSARANVVVTGGHSADADSIDYFSDGARDVPIPGPRFPDGAAHGSGCTHSSALAAHLALGLTPLEAAVAAKVVASEAVRDGLADIGAGPGPWTCSAWRRGRGARAGANPSGIIPP